MKRIKIVYILNNLEIGGAERLVLDICRLLDKKEFSISVCTVNGGGVLAEQFQALGIELKIFQKKGKIGLNVLKDLYYYLKQIKPQIVHTHMFTADTLGRLAAIFCGVPAIISTAHGIYLNESSLRKLLRWILAKFTAKIVAVSQGVQDYEIKNYKIQPNKYQLIYNGIDLQRFKFRGFRMIEPQQPIKAIIVARLEPVKGHQYLLASLPLIIKKYPNFELNIVGSGSLVEALETQVKQLGLQKQVHFWSQRLDVASILPEMDLFILPSLGEGLGLVLLEAQAVGLPVLTSKISGTVEVVADSQTGLLFAPQDSQSIYQSVDRLLSDSQLQEKIVKQAYLQVQDKFDLSKMVKSYVALYKNLLGHN